MAKHEIPSLMRPRPSPEVCDELRKALRMTMDLQGRLRQIALKEELHPRYTAGINQMLNLIRWDLVQLIEERRRSRGDEPRFD